MVARIFQCPALEGVVCHGLAVQFNTDEAFRFHHLDQTNVPGRGGRVEDMGWRALYC